MPLLSAAFLEFIPWVDKTTVCPVSVKPYEFLQFLWMLGSEIVYFRPLGCEIIEFPIAGKLADQFPIFLTNGTIAFVFPIKYPFTVVLPVENRY